MTDYLCSFTTDKLKMISYMVEIDRPIILERSSTVHVSVPMTEK